MKDKYDFANSARINKLKKLIGESENIRHGHLSGKKKKMAKKMKNKLTEKEKLAIWKRDGVKDKEPLDFSRGSNVED